jgi:hypothetical protein
VGREREKVAALEGFYERLDDVDFSIHGVGEGDDETGDDGRKAHQRIEADDHRGAAAEARQGQRRAQRQADQSRDQDRRQRDPQRQADDREERRIEPDDQGEGGRKDRSEVQAGPLPEYWFPAKTCLS